MLTKVDPSGNRRADFRSIAERYDFGFLLAEIEPQPFGMKIG